jgi:uncharacterized protein (DUF433 family)
MTPSETIEQIPLQTTADGVIRVGGTRVTLDTVVAAFETGATAEEIAQQYPSLTLGDVYAVLTYYLRHRADVDAYIARGEAQGAAIRREAERGSDRAGLRERLLARRR